MSPAFAQDPVVTRTGIDKVIGPVYVRSTGQAMDAICREFTIVQVVPEGAPGVWQVLAPMLSGIATIGARLRRNIRTRPMLNDPTVVWPRILGRPTVIRLATTARRVRRLSAKWFLRPPQA